MFCFKVNSEKPLFYVHSISSMYYIVKNIKNEKKNEYKGFINVIK